MKSLDDVVWAAMHFGLWLAARAYNVKVYGLESVESEKAALFAVKHSSNLDGPVMLHLLPKKPTTLVTKGLFIHPLINYILNIAGMMPINSPVDTTPKRAGIDTAAFRALYKTYQTNGFGMYAPEGTRTPFSVRETAYPEILMDAAKHRHRTYLVGIRYCNKYHWLSWLRLPGQVGIEVRIEPYDAIGKPQALVAEEIKQGLSYLSRLEQRVTHEISRRK